eukprot:TRINITY_DN28015_c0_g1_i1.p1 TRINITY_DN28015_c0_g1~~TRINITY_DN28015_c0_g1_i1.p1  ORF type:complete len:1041 (+),score=359.00 TRINITY_DN28015_c0_g1_i1:29-3124(+)
MAEAAEVARYIDLLLGSTGAAAQRAERWLLSFRDAACSWQVFAELVSSPAAAPHVQLFAATALKSSLAAMRRDQRSMDDASKTTLRDVLFAALWRAAAPAQAAGALVTAVCGCLSQLARLDGSYPGCLSHAVRLLQADLQPAGVVATLRLLCVVAEDVSRAAAKAADESNARQAFLPFGAAERLRDMRAALQPGGTAADDHRILSSVAPAVLQAIGEERVASAAAAIPGCPESMLTAMAHWVGYLSDEDAEDEEALVQHPLSVAAMRVLHDPSSSAALTEAAANAVSGLARVTGGWLLVQLPSIAAAYRETVAAGDHGRAQCLARLVGSVVACHSESLVSGSTAALQAVETVVEIAGHPDFDIALAVHPALECLAYAKLEFGAGEAAREALQPHLLRAVQQVVARATAAAADEPDPEDLVALRSDYLAPLCRDLEHLLGGAGGHHVLSWLESLPPDSSPASIEAGFFYLERSVGYTRRLVPMVGARVWALAERLPQHWRVQRGWMSAMAVHTDVFIKTVPQAITMLPHLLSIIEAGLKHRRSSEAASMALHGMAQVAGAHLGAPECLQPLVRVYTAPIAAAEVAAQAEGYIPPPPPEQSTVSLAVGMAVGSAADPLPVVAALVTPAGQLLTAAVQGGDRRRVATEFHRFGALFHAAARCQSVHKACCDTCGCELVIGKGWYHKDNSTDDYCQRCVLQLPEQERAKGNIISVNAVVDLGVDAPEYVCARETRQEVAAAWDAAVQQVLPCAAQTLGDIGGMAACEDIVDAVTAVSLQALRAATAAGLQPVLAKFCDSLLAGYRARPFASHWRPVCGLCGALESPEAARLMAPVVHGMVHGMLSPTVDLLLSAPGRIAAGADLACAVLDVMTMVALLEHVSATILEFPWHGPLLRLAAAVLHDDGLDDALGEHEHVISQALMLVPLLVTPQAAPVLAQPYRAGADASCGAALTAGALRCVGKRPAIVQWVPDVFVCLRRCGQADAVLWLEQAAAGSALNPAGLQQLCTAFTTQAPPEVLAEAVEHLHWASCPLS